jgi:hypothetical protein
MFAFDWLDSISNRLKVFRQSGLIIQDSRDRGNYYDDGPIHFFSTLKSHDPTGLAVGLMLNQMIEATISTATVHLSRVLREEGFIESLGQLCSLQDELNSRIGEPAKRFASQVSHQISKLSHSFGAPTDLEIAVCLRDAVYAIDQGMTLRWVERTGPLPARAPLHNQILTFESAAEFVMALKGELASGVYLANVNGCTAIAFVSPGHIAYLSSMYVSQHTGQVEQNRARDSHMAQGLDLGAPVERYPHWASCGSGETLPASLSIANHLTRDQVIWLAMLIELTHQEMERGQHGQLQLAESLTAAIGASSGLPVKYQPNWNLSRPSKHALLERIGMTPWELGFVSEFIDQIPIECLVPFAESRQALLKDELKLVAWPEEFGSTYSYFEAQDIRKRSVCFAAISPGVAGTQEEMSQLMLQVGCKNLYEWIIEKGNEKYLNLWESKKAWFAERLKKNLDHALKSGLAKATEYRGEPPNAGCILYAQSPKHKQFKPLCIINGKSPADTTLRFTPNSSHELVTFLNLKNEKSLPSELIGWVKDLGWRTDSGVQRPETAPYSNARWIFGKSNVHMRYFNAVILCSKVNLPTE